MSDCKFYLWDVLNKATCHPVYDKNIEERMFGVRMGDDEIIYTKDGAMGVAIEHLIEIIGLSQGELLHVTTGKRLKQVASVCLSP